MKVLPIVALKLSSSTGKVKADVHEAQTLSLSQFSWERLTKLVKLVHCHSLGMPKDLLSCQDSLRQAQKLTCDVSCFSLRQVIQNV